MSRHPPGAGRLPTGQGCAQVGRPVTGYRNREPLTRRSGLVAFFSAEERGLTLPTVGTLERTSERTLDAIAARRYGHRVASPMLGLSAPPHRTAGEV
jgi:hypothetical protein